MAGKASDSEQQASRVFKVNNEFGMHARPASMFVKTAQRFKCDIIVENNGIEVSGKSIMGLLTIEGRQGVRLKIIARGEDADQALDALQELFDNNFYE